MFHLVDDIATGFKCFATMRRTDADDNCDVADLELTQTVNTIHRTDSESFLGFPDDALAFLDAETFIRFVFETKPR